MKTISLYILDFIYINSIVKISKRYSNNTGIKDYEYYKF